VAIGKHGLAPVLVVVNNDGGGLFHRLPIARYEPAFTKHFATPHGLDLARVADAFGVAHEHATPATLRASMHEAVARGEARIIEVASDRVANQQRHDHVTAAVAAALEGGT
jgi:2-succinyl-5-enolpyruvyl-6-hydroxy-3-cyclohexene-1-carboxylate synthase